MTLDDLARRISQALGLCSLVVFTVAALVAVTGDSGVRQVDTLHHLFGLTLAVFGFVLFAVSAALGTLVTAKASRPADVTHDPESR